MDGDLQPALVGGIVGAIVASLLSALRGDQENRYRTRGEARVVRMEVTANLGIVDLILGLGRVPNERGYEIGTNRLAKGLDQLATDLPRMEMAHLLALENITARTAEIVQGARRETRRLTDDERATLEKSWRPAANLAQALLDFRGDRWWERFRRWSDWKRAQDELRRFDAETKQLLDPFYKPR